MTFYRHRCSGPGPAGDIWITSMHSSSTAALQDVHDAWVGFCNTFLNDTLGPMWSTEQQAQSYVTDELSPTTGRNVRQSISAVTVKGTGTGFALPQRDSVVIGLRTVVPTRAGRGRMYWPAPASDHLTADGLLIATDAQGLANGFATAMTPFQAVAQPVIFNRDQLTGQLVSRITISQVLGTQRRRTNKVAPSYAEADI